MIETGKLFADRYELIKQLGLGGFSEVWLAKDTLTNVNVAIKIYAPGTGLDDTGISLFTKEFALVFEMNHTNLLHPTHYDCYERMPYLILPYCKNGSAFKYLQNKISEKECWTLLHDVAEGLAYLHEKNPPVIHQDIKPDNILINDEGRYMITDFGISTRIRSTIRRNQDKSTDGGTLAYMGPERFSSNPAPIMASDVWSLGATLYEILTGTPPYGDHGGILQKNGADIPIINEPYSQDLKEIIYRCISKETWDRPTAKYVADYALAHLNGSDTEIHISNSRVNYDEYSEKKHTDIGSKKRKNHTLIYILLAIICIVGVISLFSILSNKDNNPNELTSIIKPDKDSIAFEIYQEGFMHEIIGDTLKLKSIDSLFELSYLNAYEKYNQVVRMYYDTTITIKRDTYLEAVSSIDSVKIKLDSAYNLLISRNQEMLKKGENNKSLTEIFNNAALVFENRAIFLTHIRDSINNTPTYETF